MDKRIGLGFEKFVELCCGEVSPEKLTAFIKFILTPEEQEQLDSRMLLVVELLEGEKTQRQISQELNISIAKITRGSNNLKLIDDDFKNYLIEKIVKNV